MLGSSFFVGWCSKCFEANWPAIYSRATQQKILFKTTLKRLPQFWKSIV